MKFYKLFQIESVAESSICIDVVSETNNATVNAESCHYLGGHQAFLITKTHAIRNDELCLDAVGVGAPITLWSCHNLQGNQKWIYNNEACDE